MFAYRGLLDRPSRNPFGLDDLFRGFDQLFRELQQEEPAITSFGYAPSRLVEEDGRFVIRLEAPGLAENDVKVNLNGGVLTVSAERVVTPPEGYTALRQERAATRFSRSYVLGDAIDPEKTAAEIKDGVLTVSVGKAESRKRKSITVKAS